MKVFVTGTDTGIGKTWVSMLLAQRALSAGQSVIYYKPVQTGTPAGQPPEDPSFVACVLQNPKLVTECRYCFEPPVAPLVADPTGIIQLDRIREDVAQYEAQSDLVLIEGAGGLMVPVTPSTLMIDVIRMLEAPVILVSHCRLGSINQTLLSLEALQKRNIPVIGIVLNFYPADLASADEAVRTIIPTLRPFVPETIPIWTSPEASQPFQSTDLPGLMEALTLPWPLPKSYSWPRPVASVL